MSNTVKILFYAINGTGLGHLNRLLVLARNAKELVQAQGLKADFRIITTSEADQTSWDFPTYKIPSKTLINESDIEAQRYGAESKMFISNLVASFRPDILVMDTMPQGSFHEFLFLKDYAKACVFIDRHKNMRVRRGSTHGATLSLYDLILAPDHADRAAQYPIPGNMEEKRLFTGPIHAFRADEAMAPETVRHYFNVPQDHSLVYVSAGGGGDKNAQTQMRLLVETAASRPQTFVLAGYGPLFRGPKVYAPNVVPLTEAAAWRFFPGVDMAICSAGYNGFQELLAACIPTAFFAQNKGMDRQDMRIDHGCAKGWNQKLDAVEPELIQESLERLSNYSTRQTMKEAMHHRPASQGALRASVAILRLHGALSNSKLERNRLCDTALHAVHWQQMSKAPEARFADAYAGASRWHQLTSTVAERENRLEASLVAWETGASTPTSYRHSLENGMRLSQLGYQSGLSGQSWLKLLKAYTSGIPGTGKDRAAECLHRLCLHLERFQQAGDGNGDVLQLLIQRASSSQLPRWVGLCTDGFQDGVLPAMLLEQLQPGSERLTEDLLADMIEKAASGN